MIDTLPPTPARPPIGFTVAWSVFALFTFLAVGGTAQLMQLAWGLWFSEIILFAGLAVIGWQLVRLDPVEAMGLRRFEPATFGLGFAFGAANYVGWAVPLMAVAQEIFPRSMVERFDSSQVFDRHSPVDLALVLIGVSVAAPLGEELFFRGFFQRQLGLHVTRARAVVVTAFIFSAFHLDPVGLTARFELGVLFGLLAWRLGSVWPAIGAHAANNFISSVLFLLSGDAKEEHLPWWVPLTMFVVGNLMLAALLWGHRARLAKEPPEGLVELPPCSPVRAFAPWLLAGVASVGLVLGLDWRGVRLNLMDAVMETPKAVRKAPEVKELRARARRGDEAFKAYEELVLKMKALPLTPTLSPEGGEGDAGVR